MDYIFLALESVIHGLDIIHSYGSVYNENTNTTYKLWITFFPIFSGIGKSNSYFS